MAIRTSIDTENNRITFTSTEGGSYTFDLSRVHPNNVRYATLHGFKQRIGDNAALSRDSTTGKSPTDEEKMAAIRALGDYYMSGAAEWSVRSNSGTGESGEGGLIARAVAAVQGLSVQEVLAKLDAKAEKLGTTRRKLLNQLATAPAVRQKMLELAPRAAEDADSLLSDLMAG